MNKNLRDIILFIIVVLFFMLLLQVLRPSMAFGRPATRILDKISIPNGFTCYSGGNIIFTDTINSKITYSDGLFSYYKGKTKIRIKADCLITSVEGSVDNGL